MYRIGLCDDEPALLEELARLVGAAARQEGIEAELECFSSCEALLKRLETEDEGLQLVFLDVLMEGLNGMALARRLRQLGSRVMIVFVSGSREFALQGYEVQAARYLAKPVDPALLQEALHYCYSAGAAQELVVQRHGVCTRVPLEEIVYAEVSGRGTLLWLRSGESRPLTEKISQLEQRLPSSLFVRSHQSYLVNLQQVQSIRRYVMTLRSGRTLPVSKQNYNLVRAKLVEYLTG